MEYKKYTNDDVFTWWESRPYMNISEVKEHKEKDYTCAIVYDYIKDAFQPELEELLVGCRIFGVYNRYGKDIVEFVVSKPKEERKDKYDIWSDRYIKPFNEVRFIETVSEGFIHLKMAMGIPLFRQHSDGRIIQKKKENEH